MKCDHGVHVPADIASENFAWSPYCQKCNPELLAGHLPFETRAVHIPRVLHEGKERANEARWDGAGCPHCGSPTYAVISGNKVICGDCDGEYTRRKMTQVLGLPVELSPEEEEVFAQ